MEFDLVVQDLEPRLSIDTFNCLLGLIEQERQRLQLATTMAVAGVDESSSLRRRRRSWSDKATAGAETILRSPPAAASMKYLQAPESKQMASLSLSQRSTRCSTTGICRKIVSKVEKMKISTPETGRLSRYENPEQPENSSSSADFSSKYVSTDTGLLDTTATATTLEDGEKPPPALKPLSPTRTETQPRTTPLIEPLTGKIVQPYNRRIVNKPILAPNSRRRNRLRKNTGVCDFTQPISNPLYKEYSPRGYVKLDDEIISEQIEELVNKFNDWSKCKTLGLGRAAAAATDDGEGPELPEGSGQENWKETTEQEITTKELYKIFRLDMEVP